MRVDRYDYAAQFGGDIDDLVADIKSMLLRGDYILGDEVARFESEFATSLGVRFAIGLNSGTDALVLALRTLGVGPGDEVITHANTFHATVAAIVHAGASPVLVDADEASYLIDVDQVAAAITARTRVVIPVHLFGKPTRMGPLLDVARDRAIHVVEDAAQAHGASLGGNAVGSIGELGCFSFHPSKNLAAAGDGGAVVTDDERFDRTLRIQRNLGQARQNEHVLLGMNSKLDAIQARILRHKLSRLNDWVAARNDVAARYRNLLAGLPISWQRVDAGEVHAYHLFQIRSAHRDELLAHLTALGVDAVTRYPTPIHLQAPFERFGWRRGQFPVAERLTSQLLCLPIRPGMTDAETEYVADGVRSFFAGRPQHEHGRPGIAT
ncbi:MAG: DegT/DnrJ/EryC1/StrS family aminotransferase [Candidatus Eremiobacterales bacterium]